MRNAFDNRTDANQPEIIKLLRQVPGLGVMSLDKVGDGFGDVLIWWRAYFMIEIKTEAGKLTKKQIERRQTWPGPIPVARSFDEVWAIINKEVA